MAVIMAFGDSNTWGYDPATGRRLGRAVRWTGVMAAALGSDHAVIEEACLRSHAPLDLVILALGCNDMKARFNVSAAEIALGAERLVMLAQSEPLGPDGAPPRVLLVAPPPLAKLSGLAEAFRGAEAKSRELAARYAEVAERRRVGFVDAGQFIRCSDLDGIHYQADQHAVLGQAMAAAVQIVLE